MKVNALIRGDLIDTLPATRQGSNPVSDDRLSYQKSAEVIVVPKVYGMKD